jgi:hypothetical protein
MMILKPKREPIYDTEPIMPKLLPNRHRARRCRSHSMKVAWKKWARALR